MHMGTGNHERERDALRTLLGSPEISRSPNLTKILSYLCEKYFAGESAQVKEYHIALEALGRPADFDQKKDSIVRVEMHRLRRRLKEHYERSGPDPNSGLQILIPEKSYIPSFVDVNALAAVPQTLPDVKLFEEPAPELKSPPPPLRRAPSGRVVLATIGSAALALFLIVRYWPTGPKDVKAESLIASTTSTTNPIPSNGDEIRILCGRQPGLYVDRFGQTWDGDRYSKGGEAVQIQNAVMAGGFDRNVFLGMRVGNHTYNIPLKAGLYQVEMLFAETEYGDGNPLEGGELSRPFRVVVNGKLAIEDIDILAETVDPNIATSRILTDVSPAGDGMLHLEFQAISTGQPFVNAIIIRPGGPGKVLPFRMVCRAQRYRDSKGHVWEPDHYFRGGSTIVRPTTPGVPDGEMFRGERYGRFAYSIPVLRGQKYQATLYFWESWLGTGRPGAGGAGSRIFSVFCNMTPLLRHYDLIPDAGPEQVKIKTFRNLEPDRNGKLVFQFDADVNKALLNAMEIIDQSLVQ